MTDQMTVRDHFAIAAFGALATGVLKPDGGSLLPESFLAKVSCTTADALMAARAIPPEALDAALAKEIEKMVERMIDVKDVERAAERVLRPGRRAASPFSPSARNPIDDLLDAIKRVGG